MDTRGTRGQSALEFALALPVFLLIVVGIIDFGRAVGSYAMVSNAAREARAGISQAVDDAAVRAAVNSQTSLVGTIPDGDITIGRLSGTPGTIQVRVVYYFHPFTSLVSGGQTITMSAESRMPMD